jgi:outer membrane lipoprotein-sorting protein
MNCRSFRKRQAELLDISPDLAATADLREHVAECPECARELDQALGVMAALRPSHKAFASAKTKERIMDRVLELESAGRGREVARPRWWSMRRPVWAAAAALVVVAVVVVAWIGASGGPSAFGTLAEAAEFVKGVKTMHMTANMRTIAHDNFALIKLDKPLIPVHIWTEFTDPPRWRVEKERRCIVMDGSSTTMLIKSGVGTMAVRLTGSATGMAGWLAPLLDVQTVFDRERRQAASEGSRISVTRRAGKTVLTVRARAQGDFSESDYLRNKSIWESDNVRVYTFDAATRRLEGIRVYVPTPKGDVFVFETTRIEYDRPVDPSLFALEVPEDATWLKDPSELPGTRDTSQMTPEEAARAFFEACAASDWDEARVYGGTMVDNAEFQKYLGGLKVIEIGKSFRSGLYPGRFVPYKIQLKSGEIKKFNLAVRNDNAKHMWSVDGGI